MRLVPMKDLLLLAREKNIALGGYVFWSVETARAAVKAGNELGLPVILMTGEGEIEMMGGYEAAVKAVEIATKGTRVPVALHLDHSRSLEACAKAIEAGFTSVMIDASAKPLEENIALTKKVVEIAHPAGVTVEAELGRLVGEEGAISVLGPEAAQTDPAEAKKFVEQTGIDCLAVCIGTQHGQYTCEPNLNFKRLEKIRELVEIPLVLHGGSCTPLSQLQRAIQLGINKINIGTDIFMSMVNQFSKLMNDKEYKYNIITFFESASVAAQKLIEEKTKAFAMTYKAED